MLRLFAILFFCAQLAPGAAYPRWGKIELAFEGPRSSGLGEPNPFAIPFDVLFTGPGGQTCTVPGFYDGDGRGGMDGSVWKVRFSADANGEWRYRTSSAAPQLDGRAGSFQVSDPPRDAPELYRKGRLEYTGARYLKFREGGYWLKFGADEPENLLGKAFGSWDEKKRQIDYLARARINSIYVMTHTLGGDGNDVWPWAGATPEEARRNHARFDVARLERWRDLLEHIQAKGLVIQMVLEDDSAWTGHDHARYYREMIARFGYLPALYFNFCEEYNERYSLEDALRYMQALGGMDPYRHPRAIHNVRAPAAAYIDSPHVEAASIQTNPSSPAALNRLAVEWWQASLARNRRPLVVSFDEARPAEDRRSWWSVYLAGGIWESYIPVENGYAAVEPAWRELAAARAFMEALPAGRMLPANHLVRAGKAFCLAAPGEVYALYLPEGGEIEVELTGGNRYRARWFDPRGGAALAWQDAESRFRAPDSRDWALVIERTAGSGRPAPIAASARVGSMRGQPVEIRLAVFGAGERPAFEVVDPPRHGRLAGTGAGRVYTPEPNFTGEDRFTWRAAGSNAATVNISANASGVNAPPRAEPLSVTMPAAESRSFILVYSDSDGPGPYEVRIHAQPKHGKLEGLDNDVAYTPAPGFTGDDAFTWTVTDGQARSKPATVRIRVEPAYFPPTDARGGWRTRAPANRAKLDEAFAAAQAGSKHGGLLVAQGGWLIYERYFGRGHRDATPNTASCGKSFTSIACGILIAEHPELFPEGLDQKVYSRRYLPAEAFPPRDPRMLEIRLGQLLAMTAGIAGNNPGRVHGKEVTLDPPGPDGWPAMIDSAPFALRLWRAPGEGYSYATASIHLASMIVRQVSGMELEQFVRTRLAEPMGWGRWGWGYRRPEIAHTPGGGGIAPRATDMLRFAYLLLREGRWGERQLIPAEYVRHCGRPSPYNPHAPVSLAFDVNGDGHVPGVPRDAFWKQGSGGHCFYVVPSLDLVVWKLGGRDEQYSAANTGLEPVTPPYDGSREGWKPALEAGPAALKTLQLVAAAVQ